MLNQKVTLYVPSTVGSVRDYYIQEEWVEKSLARFSEWFGGATAQDAQGAWISDTKGLVREKIVLVYSFCDAETLNKMEVFVRVFAQEIATAMQQECVSLELTGCLHFEKPLAKAA
jgi:hypothetical protein